MKADRNEKGQFYHGMVGAHKSHGLTKTQFYRIFSGMKTRCDKEKNHKYPRYGGRGIKCLWIDFETFYSEMYDGYLKHVEQHGERNTSIDRINNNGHYCKENCRWATWNEQQRNRGNNTLLSFNGETHSIAEWSEITGIAAPMISTRIRKGWNIEKTLTKKGLRLFTYKGKTQSLADWSRELGIHYQKLWSRINEDNWPIERAFTNKDFRLI